MALLSKLTEPSKSSKRKKPATSCWEKGKSGNPAGRPLGSRNKSTLFLESLLENEAEPLTRKMIQVGLTGNPMALRFCLGRLLPRRRGRPIQLPLRGLSSASALKLILANVGEGEITPEEGEILANIVGKQVSIENEDMERRLSEQEKVISEQEKAVSDQEKALSDREKILAKTSDKTNPVETVSSEDDDENSEAQSEDTSLEKNTTTEPESASAKETSPASGTGDRYSWMS